MLARSGPHAESDSFVFSPDGTRLGGIGLEGGKLMVKVWDATPLRP